MNRAIIKKGDRSGIGRYSTRMRYGGAGFDRLRHTLPVPAGL